MSPTHTSMSANAQAILLLTAPLIAGRESAASSELLSPGEYRRLARQLREMQRQPADFLSPEADELIDGCKAVVDRERMKRLLGRGFLLSQALERWRTRAIWVVSRADADYPRRLKTRLKDEAPAILYGCGDPDLLETGGLAVVGSRNVDAALIEYTEGIGRLTAKARRSLVSGGARGIDQAAMRGALEAGGKVIGVLGDSLEKTAMNREHRNLLLDGQLVLISPFDPNAGFNVGNAMQRNKLIYTLADAALVVSSDFEKGGTWAGAVEQIDKLELVPVYVRSAGAGSKGLDALQRRGALPWPDPEDAEGLGRLLDSPATIAAYAPAPDLFAHAAREPDAPPACATPEVAPSAALAPTADTEASSSAAGVLPPSEELFQAVRKVLAAMLTTPKKDSEIAAALDVSTAQAKVWLARLIAEGVLEKRSRPVGYVVRQAGLFSSSQAECAGKRNGKP